MVEQLKVMYKQKILPLEKDYKFEDFHSPGMTDTDFDAKPMVLLIGQYSTGKLASSQHNQISMLCIIRSCITCHALC